ncbi:MAG: type II secretion system protein [Candidatus Dormibacteraceae bacterium]
MITHIRKRDATEGGASALPLRDDTRAFTLIELLVVMAETGHSRNGSVPHNRIIGRRCSLASKRIAGSELRKVDCRNYVIMRDRPHDAPCSRRRTPKASLITALWKDRPDTPAG